MEEKIFVVCDGEAAV
jgi:hypothetical protein